MNRRTRRPNGFTLLEVLVSLAILSATLVAAYRVTSGAIAATQRSERWTTASLLGEAKLRAVTETFPEVQETDGRFPAPDDAYGWHVVVKQAMHADAREVYVTVSWTEDDKPESITLPGLAVR